MPVKATHKAILVLGLSFFLIAMQAVADTDGMTSLFNPWNTATQATEKAIERSMNTATYNRTFSRGGSMGLVSSPDSGRTQDAAGEPRESGFWDRFSSWNIFTDYDFGKLRDTRQGGFDNDIDIFTVGVDALYNNDTLWGFLAAFGDARGKNQFGDRDTIDSTAYTLYVARHVDDWLFDAFYYGAALTYGTAEAKIKGVPGSSDSDYYAVSPYLTLFAGDSSMFVIFTSSYDLCYQKTDYSNAAIGSDSALMGKVVFRTTVGGQVTENIFISGNLNYNQVIHNRALDSEFDNDHSWFTAGVQMNCGLTENLIGRIGYSTELGGNFDSNIYTVGLSYYF